MSFKRLDRRRDKWMLDVLSFERGRDRVPRHRHFSGGFQVCIVMKSEFHEGGVNLFVSGDLRIKVMNTTLPPILVFDTYH